MANHIIHKAESRGYADHGWLKSYHSFSFAGYYNAERIHFGALRVLNDDFVEGGKGFGKHPHQNMEIISIPLEGDLEHQDSMGNIAVIKKGDVQVMSAGSGIEHSEYNKNLQKPVKFLQIWILPDKKNVAPRYDQLTLDEADRINKLQQILSPDKDDKGVWIHQQAWMHLGKFSDGKEVNYVFNKSGNGAYVFILRGTFEVDEQSLQQRDGMGITQTEMFSIKALSDEAEILIIEVPMIIN